MNENGYNEKLEQVYSREVGCEINPSDLLSAAGFIISSAPPDGDINNVVNTMVPIGLVSSMQLASTKNITPAFELGTRTRTLLASKGQKQVSLGKVRTFAKNVMAALYAGAGYAKTSPPNEMYDVASDGNALPFGLVISIITESRDLLCHIYFTNVYIEDHTESRTAGERGVMEQAILKWSNSLVLEDKGGNGE